MPMWSSLPATLDCMHTRTRPFGTVQWIVYSPEGTFPCVANGQAYEAAILRMGGPHALAQWKDLQRAMLPLQQVRMPGVGVDCLEWCCFSSNIHIPRVRQHA
jgi:hypothetical protein